MHKICSICNRVIRTGDIVQLTVIAEYHELRSEVTFSIGKPFDSYPETLQHIDCANVEANGNV